MGGKENGLTGKSKESSFQTVKLCCDAMERVESEEEKVSKCVGERSKRKDGGVATLKQLNSAGLTGDQ